MIFHFPVMSFGGRLIALGWLSNKRSLRIEPADGQTTARLDNIVIRKDGRMFDVSGTAEAQSRWSAYAAIAASSAAALQTLSIFLKD
jgi:hypothetical protein